MRVITATSKRQWIWISVALGIILIGSFLMNCWGNDFPLWLHPDEIKKVIYISGDKTTDFYHPELILQFGRLFADISSASSQQDVVQAGRTSTAFLGSLAVLFTFYLARQFLSAPASLLAAGLTAVSPGIVIHSHYLKEDIALTCFATASLLLAIVSAKESVGEVSSKRFDYIISFLFFSTMAHQENPSKKFL
jgi:4-amino-4-deoxy-L-arabinose transferase-like glycosyltransferase